MIIYVVLSPNILLTIHFKLLTFIIMNFMSFEKAKTE